MPGSRSTATYSYGTTSKGVPPATSLSNLGADSPFDSEEISSFSDQPDVITYAATTQPKPGVFINEIYYLLVLSTGVPVSSVAGRDGRVHKGIKMYATDMSVSPDVEMTSVVGTAGGRIFVCGSQDGYLYELYYQEKGGWFGKRAQLINRSVGKVRQFPQTWWENRTARKF